MTESLGLLGPVPTCLPVEGIYSSLPETTVQCLKNTSRLCVQYALARVLLAVVLQNEPSVRCAMERSQAEHDERLRFQAFRHDYADSPRSRVPRPRDG